MGRENNNAIGNPRENLLEKVEYLTLTEVQWLMNSISFSESINKNKQIDFNL